MNLDVFTLGERDGALLCRAAPAAVPGPRRPREEAARAVLRDGGGGDGDAAQRVWCVLALGHLAVYASPEVRAKNARSRSCATCVQPHGRTHVRVCVYACMRLGVRALGVAVISAGLVAGWRAFTLSVGALFRRLSCCPRRT